MKYTAGNVRPRRSAAPKKKVRLDLKRRPMPEPEDELGIQQKNHFWKWVGLVALLHVVVISIVYLIYEAAPTPKPPDQFMSLLPPGDVVKGTAGAQEAHKLGPTTAAPAVHHAPAPTPPPTPAVQPKPVTPPAAAIQPPKPAPKPIPPKPVVKTETPTPLADKPITPPKPVPPKPPKVKVDLHLADGPVPDKPVTKTKPHLKKPAEKTSDESEKQDHEATSKPNSAGLSKEQIAAKLGEKMDASGVKNSIKSGTSGSVNSHANPFADFYASIRDQVMSQWESPNLTDETAVNPIVRIHVEKDGRVPAESVHLIQSSGNPTYDDSAVTAAKNLGYLHQPLPEGCPPDIPITFKLTR
jgi:TonB family protein